MSGFSNVEMSGSGPHMWHDGARYIESQRAGSIADHH
ncbi:MAG: hypothetical protein ACI8TX_003332, partial [Hyphomicrobiaceae bacterium]